MKFKIYAVVMSCALLSPLGVAQDAAPTNRVPTKDVPAPGPRHPLLWKVSDADNSIYLLGSFHLLKESDYPMPEEIDRAFRDSSSLYFESDPAAIDTTETQAMARKYMGFDDGRTLSSVISPQAAAKLGTLMSASGTSLQAVEPFEPWAVSLSLSLGVMQALGFRSDMGLDRRMAERATEAGKPVHGLETVEAGFAALDGVPMAEQLRDLDEFLDNPLKIGRRLQDLHDWWRSGDVAALEAEMQAEMVAKTPETYRLLVVERNRNWMPQLVRRLADEHKDNTLVVVGAMHLLGSDGLVEQLRAKGYKVERVCDGCEAPASVH